MMIKKTVFLFSMSVFMASSVWAGGIGIKLDGEEVTLTDAQPVIENGRTLVPLRGVFEKMGYTVNWYSDTKTAELCSDTSRISVTAGYDVLVADGEEKQLDCGAKIIDGRMYIPLRAVSETGGATVSWDSETKTVYIYSGGNEGDGIYAVQKGEIFKDIDFDEFEKLIFSATEKDEQTVVESTQKMLSRLQGAYTSLSALSVPEEYASEHTKSLSALVKLQEVCSEILAVYGK